MTHLSRPRLWLAASLAALSLMVFVTLRVRRTAAQETPVENPAVQKPESETNANTAAPTSPKVLVLDLHNGNFIVRIPVTAKMLRTPGIQVESLVDVFYERLGELPPETERMEKLFTDIKVESLFGPRGAKADSPPSTIGLVLKSKQADTLKMTLESKQCDVFFKLAESTAKNPPPAADIPGFSDTTGNVEKESKKSPTQRKSTMLVQGEIVVLPKELIESQRVMGGNNGVAVAVGQSRNCDLLFGYSVPLRKWVKQPTDVSQVPFESSNGDSVAVVTLQFAESPAKKTYFAFSAEVGHWASIEVSADASSPTIHNNKIVVTDGETTHVFKSDTGEWSSPMAEVTDNEARKPDGLGGLPGGAQGGGGFGGFMPAEAGFFAMPGGGIGFGGSGGGMSAGGGSGVYQSSQSTILFSNDVVAIPKEAIGSGQIIQGGSLAIIASNKHDMLWGYSEPLGKWFKQPVSLDVEGLIPVVGAQVAAVIPKYKTKPEKKKIFIFSSIIGRWASLEVSLNASEPAVHAKMVVVTDGETTHVFKGDTGKWSTPTALVADNERLSAPNAPTAESDLRPPHPYAPPYLRYSDGREVYLVDLDADGVLDVVPADETKSSHQGEDHSIVGAWQMVRETTRNRREVAEEQAALQESLGPKHPAMVKVNARLAELEAEEREWVARLKAFVPPASFGRVTVIDWQSRLKSELQQAERDAEQAARAVKSPKNARDKEQAQVRLRESVGKAFASRQKLQQLEAELLRERLRQVDDRLQERNRLQDRIIQRRVEELTNSNLEWGASEPRGLGEPEGVSPRTPNAPNPVRGLTPSGSPITLPGPVSVSREYKPLGPTPISLLGPSSTKPDNRQVFLSLKTYDANDTAMKELGLDAKSDATGTVISDKEKLAKLPELVKQSHLKLLMEPTTTVLNGHKASFLNGGEFPVPTIVGVGEAQGTTTAFRWFGFEFQAQPVVLDNGQVRLSATISESKINNDNPEATGGVPSLDSKRLKTELLLTQKEPVLLGPIGVTRENKTRLIVTITAEVVKPEPKSASAPAPILDLPSFNPESPTPQTGSTAEAVAIVNGEAITYRNLVRWRISLKELDGVVNYILLKQATNQAKFNFSDKQIDTEVQRIASDNNLSIDQWYSMLEKERGINRDHYREIVAWSRLALKRLAGDDEKQQLKFLADLRATAKIELVDPDAKLRPVSPKTTEPAPPPVEKSPDVEVPSE